MAATRARGEGGVAARRIRSRSQFGDRGRAPVLRSLTHSGRARALVASVNVVEEWSAVIRPACSGWDKILGTEIIHIGI